MTDQVLTCKRCSSPFVYSTIEQSNDQKQNKPLPSTCPICTAIIQNEAKHPPKK